jgi:SAM-dependent methyltransferase
MPFEDGVFDISFCRQGIQFMNGPGAVQEMVRVTRPGGRICLVHLTAYGEEDKEEYFEVLRLRNPARKNFYLRTDLETLLSEAGCEQVVVHSHVSPEDVDAWSDNGAIPEEAREGIRRVYRQASPTFQELHAVATGVDGRFTDHMLFGIAIGVCPH